MNFWESQDPIGYAREMARQAAERAKKVVFSPSQVNLPNDQNRIVIPSPNPTPAPASNAAARLDSALVNTYNQTKAPSAPARAYSKYKMKSARELEAVQTQRRKK